MLEDDLNNAIALNKSGKKVEAREILKKIILDDPKNERAWMWLADTYPDNANRIVVLEEYLKNNPDNQIAQKGLATLKAEEAKKGKTIKCPNCGIMNQVEAIVCSFCGRDLQTQTPVISEPIEALKESATNVTINTDDALQQKRKGKGWIFFIVIIALFVAAWLLIRPGVFTIQPIDALPDGITIIYHSRSSEMPFFSSPDGLCIQIQGSVSLLCRMTAMAAVSDLTDRIIVRLPYSRWAYLRSTGGLEFEK